MFAAANQQPEVPTQMAQSLIQQMQVKKIIQ